MTTRTRPRRAAHVRYSSPFGGTSGYMLREDAERHDREDDARYLLLQSLGLLDERARQHGPPIITELPR